MGIIGKRIFYDISTGNILIDTGEKQGSVTSTTIDQDITTYKALNERVRESFDVIELNYGDFSQEFSSATSYRVNPTTKEIEFNYDPLFTIDDYKQFKKDEMFEKYEADLLNGFISSLKNVEGIPYEIFYDDIAQTKFNSQTNKVNLLLNQLSLGHITQAEFDAKFPISWRTKNVGLVNLSYDEFILLIDEAEQHERSLFTKRLEKEAYIDTLTTKDEIEAVVW